MWKPAPKDYYCSVRKKKNSSMSSMYTVKKIQITDINDEYQIL